MHTENLQVQLVKAAHQAHEAIVNGTITTPQTATIELTQAKRLNERSGGHGAVPTRRKDHAPSNGGSCSASCRNPQDSQVELVPDSQDVGSEAAPEGESVADTSDWCSEWSRSPQNRWNEEEKSNPKHDMCEATGREEPTGGWGGEGRC